MDKKLLERYRKYARSEEAFAVLLVKQHLAEAKGHWIDIINSRRFQESENNMHFRFVVGGLFKKKIHPKYPPRSDFTTDGKFNEIAYYETTRAITWATAHKDIEQQQAKRISPQEFHIRGVRYDRNAGRKGFFRDDAPPEIKALADNLQDRTNPLWDKALQFANAPDYVYEVREAHILTYGD